MKSVQSFLCMLLLIPFCIASAQLPEQELGLLALGSYNGIDGYWWMSTDGSETELIISNVALYEIYEANDWIGFNDYAISPDAQTLAAVVSQPDTEPNFREEIYLIDIATKVSTRITDSSSAIQSPAWSPDGSTLAYCTDDGIYRLSIETGLLEPLVTFDQVMAETGVSMHSSVHCARWSADGNALLFTVFVPHPVTPEVIMSSVFYVTLENGNLQKLAPDSWVTITPLVDLEENTAYIVPVDATSSELYTLDMQTNALTPLLPIPTHDGAFIAGSVDVSPQGLIAYTVKNHPTEVEGYFRYSVHVIDLSTQPPAETVLPISSPNGIVQWFYRPNQIE